MKITRTRTYYQCEKCGVISHDPGEFVQGATGEAKSFCRGYIMRDANWWEEGPPVACGKCSGTGRIKRPTPASTFWRLVDKFSNEQEYGTCGYCHGEGLVPEYRQSENPDALAEGWVFRHEVSSFGAVTRACWIRTFHEPRRYETRFHHSEEYEWDTN